MAIMPVGLIIFLATPNSYSILYRLKGDLPFLDWPINFYIPGNKDLSNALKNYGYWIEDIVYLIGIRLIGNFPETTFKYIINI